MSRIVIKGVSYHQQAISSENMIQVDDILVLSNDRGPFKANKYYPVIKRDDVDCLCIETAPNGSVAWITPTQLDPGYTIYRRERSIPVPTRFERMMIAKYVQEGITVTSRKLAIDSVVFFESDKESIIARIKEQHTEYAECDLSLRTANYSTYQAPKRPGFYDVHVDFDVDASYIVEKFKLKEFGQ